MYVPVTLDSIIMAISIIMSNLGARYILVDIDKKHATYFGNNNMKYVYIFCMTYLGSRNIFLSTLFAILYTFV
jgi:hypothetical protein